MFIIRGSGKGNSSFEGFKKALCIIDSRWQFLLNLAAGEVFHSSGAVSTAKGRPGVASRRQKMLSIRK